MILDRRSVWYMAVYGSLRQSTAVYGSMVRMFSKFLKSHGAPLLGQVDSFIAWPHAPPLNPPDMARIPLKRRWLRDVFL